MRPQPTLIGLLVLITGIVAGCGSSQPVASTSTAAQPALNIHIHQDRYQFNTAVAMCNATFVADAQVISKGKSFWNTPDTLKPTGLDENSITKNGYSIYTPVQLNAVTPYIDHRLTKNNTFVTMGGKVDADTYQIDDYPQLKTADHFLVVFVPRVDPINHSSKEDMFVAFAAFPIDAQGMVELQPQTIEQGKVSQVAVRVALADLKLQLQACK